MTQPSHILVTLSIVRRQEYWIAYCPALKTYGYSNRNEEEALADFDRAIETFFLVQETLGSLNQTLLTLGWTRSDHKVNAPTKSFNSGLPPYRSQDAQKVERRIAIPA